MTSDKKNLSQRAPVVVLIDVLDELLQLRLVFFDLANAYYIDGHLSLLEAFRHLDKSLHLVEYRASDEQHNALPPGLVAAVLQG